jgi:5-formyltetrahydrofolate cyclo-ligase
MTRSKADWRRVLLSARASIPEGTRRLASDAIASRLWQLRCIREARTLFGYIALGAEVDTTAILTEARDTGVPVLVPSTTRPGDESFVTCAWSRDGEPVAVQSVPIFPAVAIVPGVGFDTRGTRLGRGAGFYDRALASLRAAGPVTVIGIAFEVQIVGSLPRDHWDQAMDFVASENRLLDTSNDGIGHKNEVRSE